MFVRILLLVVAAGLLARAQPPQFSNTARGFIKVDAAVVALTNARVIDGTAAPARENQTLVIPGGNIAEIAGTDPTGGGGVVPGFSNQRQLELLVGFSPIEAIRIGTLNGASYLGRAERVGSIAVGKQADLVVINGNPAASIADVRKVETVFKQGIGFDPAKLIASVSGKVGLW